MDETVPDDIANLTQQEINYLAEFLNNFDKGPCEITSNTRRFNMEKVGQYLEDKNLTISTENDIKQYWENLIEQNQCLSDCEFIYPHHKNFSLIQQHKLLKNSINDVFTKPEKLIGDNFKIIQTIKCIDNKHNGKLFTTFVSVIDENIGIFALLESPSIIILLEFHKNSKIKLLKIHLQHHTFFENKFSQFGDLTFRHIQFYNKNILSILLDSNANNKKLSCFLQFPLTNVRDMMTEINYDGNLIELTKICRTINIYDVLDPLMIRNIDNLDAHLISVSGNRKVSSILSENLRRIRFYEMETEEDDDEIDVSQNNSLDNSKDSNV